MSPHGMLAARDIMTRKLITIRPETTVGEAIDVLVSHQISGVPVVNESGALVGILTEHDCLRVLARAEYDADYPGMRAKVAELMSEPRHTIAPDLGIFSIAEYLLTHRIRRLAVVDAGALVGLVSRRDVLRGVREMVRRRRGPPEAARHEPGLYPSATGTPPTVIAERLK